MFFDRWLLLLFGRWFSYVALTKYSALLDDSSINRLRFLLRKARFYRAMIPGMRREHTSKAAFLYRGKLLGDKRMSDLRVGEC